MKTYEITIAGMPHTIQLSDADAKARGLTPVETKQQTPPKNKQATARNKSAAPDSRDD